MSSDGAAAYVINTSITERVVRGFKTDTGAALMVTPNFELRDLDTRFLAISPDDKQLAVAVYGDRSIQVDRSIQWLEAKTGKSLGKAVVSNQSSIRSLAFAGEKHLVANVTNSKEGGLMVVDTEQGKQARFIKAQFQTFGGFSAFISSSRQLVAPTFDFRTRRKEPTLMFWDIDTGKIVDRFELSPVQYTSIATAHDGKIVLLGTSTGDIELWNVARQKLHATLRGGHRGAAACLAVSPDGTTFASGGADTTVLLWKLPAK